jgi:hypothetical protein
MHLSTQSKIRMNDIQSNFDKRKGREDPARKAPAYRIMPMNVAHSACETSQIAQETSQK